MINYDETGNSSVLFHYGTRLNSTYLNKLLLNIFNPGIISGWTNINIATVDDNGVYTIVGNGQPVTAASRLIISPGWALLIRPDNANTAVEPYASTYAALTDVEKEIIDNQLIKCNITKEIVLTIPSDTSYVYLCARLLWDDDKATSVEFYFSQTWTSTTPQYILKIAYLSYYGADGDLLDLELNDQTTSTLDSNILYNMNVDMLNGYHVGNETVIENIYANPVYTIPISNAILNENLNVEFVDGFTEAQLGKLSANNTNLNAEFIVDENLKQYQPGTALGGIPISNTVVVQGLNAEKLEGQLVTEFADINHAHYLHELDNGQFYKLLQGVNASNLATNNSFATGAFRREKLSNRSFIAKNDDYGGQLKIVTGAFSTSWTSGQRKVVVFDAPFVEPPVVMLQIKGTGYYATKMFKLQAVDISTTSFTIAFESYGIDGGNGFSGYNAALTTEVDYCALGYGYGTGI